MQSVTGTIVYWVTVVAVNLFMLAGLLAGLFYFGRWIFRLFKRPK